MLKSIFAFLVISATAVTGLTASPPTQKATFAGGCFWCMESPFEKAKGVDSVVSGYIGGHTTNPNYKDVSSGGTGHVEAVQITFNPRLITYSDLLEIFWRQVNPTDAGGQFVDRGSQYVTGIYYHNEDQKQLAIKSKAKLEKSKRFSKAIVTPIKKATIFYKAEDYHQDYYRRNPIRYKYYRSRSGRDKFLDKTWGKDKKYVPGSAKAMSLRYSKPSGEQIKKMLSPVQYKVTQKNGTERPFKNKYWNNKEQGIYVDVVSGEPLFSSLDKYKSGTGWPSFTKPLENQNVVEKQDNSLFMSRTEVRSKYGDSHLGHVFNDGPAPTGLRYCINSASLRFIPVKNLKKEGYEKYIPSFDKKNSQNNLSQYEAFPELLGKSSNQIGGQNEEYFS